MLSGLHFFGPEDLTGLCNCDVLHRYTQPACILAVRSGDIAGALGPFGHVEFDDVFTLMELDWG